MSAKPQAVLDLDAAHEQAIVTANAAGVTTSWSMGAQATFGWTAAEMVGESFGALFSFEDRAAGAPLEKLRSALQGSTAVKDQWLRRKDGSEVLVCGSIHPLRSSEPSRPTP